MQDNLEMWQIHVLKFTLNTTHHAVSSEKVNVDKHYQLLILVYLQIWYDIETYKTYKGGQSFAVDAPLHKVSIVLGFR